MVGNQNGRRAKIAAVDLDYVQRAHEPAYQEIIVAPQEDRQWKQHVRRERSSAYWFAATKWGMLGLVTGMLIGGGGMYVATMGNLEIAQSALERAVLMRQVQDAHNSANPPAPEELKRLPPPSESTP